MGLFFNYLIIFLEDELAYDKNFKSLYLIGSVLSALIFYLFTAFVIKAFKINDIKLKY